MSRGRRREGREKGTRRCIVTRASAPRAGLLRFVRGPDGVIVPDLAERLPGRGIWVTAERALLDKAVKTRLFARAAKGPAEAPPDLSDRVESLLARRLIDTIALARKSGAARVGRDQTREALISGHAAVLIQAADGSPREKAELRPPEGEAGHITCLDACELGMAFGRGRVIHAALLAGALADRALDGALKLRGFRREMDGRVLTGHAGEEGAGEGSRGKG